MDITNFFENDLAKLATEISLFKDEKSLWKTKEGITNSAGNLALHITGNLNHFIGKTMGNTDYVRNRDGEFSFKDIPRDQIISGINKVKEIIKNTLPKLSPADLQKDFPIKIREEVYSTQNMLIYLLAHLNYHLGQINYLRRIIN
ncbi:MAG TPA: DUF1572 family protein [Hanamia sp.]|nr:DUF1572 family protein [Hanamia sp.]